MRAVITRTTGATLTIDGQEHARIGQGLLVLLGVVGREDLRWIRGLVRPVDKSGQAGVS